MNLLLNHNLSQIMKTRADFVGAAFAYVPEYCLLGLASGGLIINSIVLPNKN